MNQHESTNERSNGSHTSLDYREQNRSGNADGVTEVEVDWSTSFPVTHAVVDAVTTATGLDQYEIQLYPDIDPDALEALFRRPWGGETNGDVTVTFSVEGREVIVERQAVRVCPQ